MPEEASDETLDAVVGALKSIANHSRNKRAYSLEAPCPSLLIEKGGNIRALKELLGRSSLDMTLIYSHLAPGALAGEVGKIKL